jgi:hypothetical protein
MRAIRCGSSSKVALCLHLGKSRDDILDAVINAAGGTGRSGRVPTLQHQPDTAAVEVDELAEAVQPGQSERVLVEGLGTVGIGDMQRKLAVGGPAATGFYPGDFSSAGAGGGSSVAGASLASVLRSFFSSFFCFLASSFWRF